MARLVEWHDDHRWNAKRVRFRSAVRRRRLREWLRRIPRRCQRPVLLPPVKEEILVALVDAVIAISEAWCTTSLGEGGCSAVRLQCFTLNDFASRSIFPRNEPPNPAKYFSERPEMTSHDEEPKEGQNEKRKLERKII